MCQKLCTLYHNKRVMSTGKTIESLENRDSVKVCRTKHEYLCEISKSTFKKAIIVSPDLVLVTHRRVCVVYNKPFLWVSVLLIYPSTLCMIIFTMYYENVILNQETWTYCIVTQTRHC